LLEHDNMILIEAVSSKYLRPELSEAGHQTLLFMGSGKSNVNIRVQLQIIPFYLLDEHFL